MVTLGTKIGALSKTLMFEPKLSCNFGDNQLSSMIIVLSQFPNSEWRNCGMKIKGISWAKQESAVTHGITIWTKPFIVTTPSLGKVSIIKGSLAYMMQKS